MNFFKYPKILIAAFKCPSRGAWEYLAKVVTAYYNKQKGNVVRQTDTSSNYDYSDLPKNAHFKAFILLLLNVVIVLITCFLFLSHHTLWLISILKLHLDMTN